MSQYLPFLEKMAEQYGVPAEEVRAIYDLESSSGRNPGVSSAGARGHMQLMPGTAREMGVRDINDPYENIRGGVRYYALQRRKFGDPALAAAAYNAGPGRVQQAGNRVPNIRETRDYVSGFLNKLGRPTRPTPSPRPAVSATTPETPLQGQPNMDETETPEELTGGLGMAAPTAADFEDWQRRSMALQQEAAATRKQQFEQGQALIKQLYSGPSRQSQLWALSQAFLSPKPYRGFAGTMANVGRALSGVNQQQEDAQRQRQEALLRLQQTYQTGETEGAATALDRELQLLKLRANAAAKKPAGIRPVVVDQGVPYEPMTGERVVIPNQAAWSALEANPSAENYDRFVATFGPRFADKALTLVRRANPNLRVR